MLRLVDDIYIGSDNIDDAHTYLSGIRDAIRAFELDINESKTVILSASDDLEPYWPVEIRRELERYKSEGLPNSQMKADFVHFMDEILRKAASYKDEGIVKFAVRKMDELAIWTEYWDIIEPFLVRAAINFPHCWDYVARVVAWRNVVKSIDQKKWIEVIDKSIRQNVKSGHDSEISWALWLLKEIEGPLDKEIFEAVLLRCGPMPCLIALDIHEKSKAPYKIPKEALLERLGDQPMLSNNWLLAYEGDRQFGLKIKSKNIQGNQFFKQLYDDDVSFYNRDAESWVFEDEDDKGSVKFAIEKGAGGYDSLYEDGDDDDDDDEF
ncbi:hypothetical protein ASD50_16455 [Mesorhizobium sp. Root552]|nr:hypothetical protein ASD50_16455 [Mesorhizobium sp. Root552]